MTVTLFNIIRSELINRGHNEFVNEQGELVFFNKDYQFTNKILSYDHDVSTIVNDLFMEHSLNYPEYDTHFKKTFLLHFVNRRINRQTIEAFQMELLSTFFTNEHFINTIYEDIEKFIIGESLNNQTNKQKSKQESEGGSISDNRQAYSELPQTDVQLDVDNTVMYGASDNTISRNKQRNNQITDNESSGEVIGTSKSYKLDELLKSSGLLDEVFKMFDKKCFMQVW